MFKKNIVVGTILLLGITVSLFSVICVIVLPYPFSPSLPSTNLESLAVKINIDPDSIICEGDIIDCNITGNPTVKYWQINNQSIHTTFHRDDPIIFDPEPTPLNEEYVNLTVYAEDDTGNAYDTVRIQVKRLFFGDIHFHSTISDGYHEIDTLYQNAIKDNYLDFVCLTDHAEIINGIDHTPPQPLWMRLHSLVQFIRYKLSDYDEWQIIKDKATEYYNPGNFTTFLGFEYSPGPWYPGGWPWSPNGHEDICHVNFYYKDIYPDAPEYSAWDKHTLDDIFKAMGDEWDKGHLNVGFPHHPLMKISIFGAYSVNWTFLANDIINTVSRDKVLRGVETYSKWGTAIGKYSGIPILWPYDPASCCDYPEYWTENGLWEWSNNARKNQRFVLMASSDNHAVDRPGSASMQSRVSGNHPNPSGILAAYAVHNTRDEIWDAMNNCSVYGSQTLKIRTNVRFDEQMASGRWINCTSPLKIQITALSTFPGIDRNGRRMHPHGYPPDELDYPIMDIWLVKKDRSRGQPWCKIIGNAKPNTNLAVVEFEDSDVQPNDFYYVVIRQKGALLEKENSGDKQDAARDEYMAFIGPVFIDNVEHK